MTIIDIILLVVIGAGAVIGFIKGFIKQLASILGLIVGLLAAKALYVSVAERVFSKITDSMTFAQILAFVVIWIVVPLLFLLVICVVEFLDSDNTMIDRTMKEESVLYYPIESFAGMFFPAAKEVTEQYILNT